MVSILALRQSLSTVPAGNGFRGLGRWVRYKRRLGRRSRVPHSWHGPGRAPRRVAMGPQAPATRRDGFAGPAKLLSAMNPERLSRRFALEAQERRPEPERNSRFHRSEWGADDPPSHR